MKIDFHTCTAPLTKKALQKPEEVFAAAKDCGLDGLVLTETNIVRPYPAFVRLHDLARSRFGLTIFQGLYLHTTLGPVLIYGQSIAQAGESGIKIETEPDTAAVVEYCIDQGWCVVLAHPFRYGVGPERGMCHDFKDATDPVSMASQEVGYIVRRMHGVEISGACSRRDNDYAEGLARELNLPILVGSGACYPKQIKPGCWTKVPQSMSASEQIAKRLVVAATKGTDNGTFRIPDLGGLYKAGRNARSPGT